MGHRKPKLDTINDRMWWAYHAMSRAENGALPLSVEVDVAASVPKGTLSKFFRGELRSIGQKRIDALAQAMGVSPHWLQYAEGEMPICHFPVGSRPRRFDDRLSDRSTSVIAGDDIVKALVLQGLEKGRTKARVYELLERQEVNAFEIYAMLLSEETDSANEAAKSRGVEKAVRGKSRVRSKVTKDTTGVKRPK